MQPVLVFPSAHLRGGVERVVWESLRDLSARYPTTFLGDELDHSLELPNVQHIVPGVPPKAARGVRKIASFYRRVSRCPPLAGTGPVVTHGVIAPPGDVVHVHSLHRAWLEAGRDVRVGPIRVPSRSRKLLVRHQLLLELERRYFRSTRPRAVIAVSVELADDLQRLYGVDPDLIRIIPNGFDPKTYNPERRSALRDSTRAEFEVPDDTIVILFVANELHRKGFASLLEAVAMLGSRRVEIHVVGSANPESYERRISSLGLRTQVRYHGPTEDVGRFHALADLLVLPTQYETFAMVVLEALASGLPVIVTAGTPGAGQLVAHDVNGLVVDDPTDASALASMIDQATDDARRRRWSLHAPGAETRGYEWRTITADVERVLLEVTQ